MTLNKTIEFLTKTFKIMHFIKAYTVNVDDIQRIVNIILYKQLNILFVIVLIVAK